MCRITRIGKLLNTNKYLNKLEKTLMKSDYDESEFVGNMLGRYRKKEIVPKYFFGTPKKVMFKNIMVNIPEKSHELLTALYGDYMKLPPLEERVAHNVKIIR